MANGHESSDSGTSESASGIDTSISDLAGTGRELNESPDSANIGTDGKDSAATDPSSLIPVKRGRGRPRKDGTSGPGPGPGPTAPKSTAGKTSKGLDLNLFATNLVGLHQLLVLMTKEEALSISQKEADSLAVAIKNVLVHYDMTPNPVILAWGQLIGVMAAVYGPRLFLIKLKHEQLNALKKQQRATAEHAAGAANNAMMAPGSPVTQ